VNNNLSGIPLVRAAYSEPFLLAFREIGIPISHYFREARIPCEMEVSPETWIPEAPWWSMTEKMARREGIPDLGLIIGSKVPIYNIKTLEPLLINSCSLLHLLKDFCAASRTQTNNDIFDLLRTSSGIWFRSLGPSLSEKDESPLRLYHLLSMLQVVQKVLGASWRPDTIYVQNSYNREIQTSPLLGAQKIYFNAPITAFFIPEKYLMPKDTPPPNIESLAGMPPKEFLDTIVASMTFQMQGGSLNLQTLSELTGVSVRTLQRRFAECGVSYTELLKKAKQEKAEQLIKKDKKSLSEISDLLGYSDYTKFSRAFKSRSGLTPRQYQKTLYK
jgi:AraC-like DNA-binding protein